MPFGSITYHKIERLRCVSRKAPTDVGFFALVQRLKNDIWFLAGVAAKKINLGTQFGIILTQPVLQTC